MNENSKNIEAMDDDMLEAVAGGTYSVSEFASYGVTRDNKIFAKDKFYYNGKQISKDVAEYIVMIVIK